VRQLALDEQQLAPLTQHLCRKAREVLVYDAATLDPLLLRRGRGAMQATQVARQG
jgi:hypothetical protein